MGEMSVKRKSIFGFLLTGICIFAYIIAPVRVIFVRNIPIIVEIARTPEQQEKGLQKRKFLGQNRGMLFIFKEASDHTFWMKDTYIPLDIAFIDKNKVIVNIQGMVALDSENKHHAYQQIKYALELNAGWCKKNNIKPGDRVYF